MVRRQARTIAVLAGVLIMSSCGDDYTKNQDQGSEVKSTQKDADAGGKSGTDTKDDGTSGDETQSGSTDTTGGNSQNDGTASGNNDGTTDTSSGVTIQDILAGIFGNGNANDGNNTGNTGNTGTGQTGGTTPVQPAPEPTADDCIGADEFICAVEVAITYHTNLLRTGSDLMHHARLSYVARDWSRQQMQRGSIGHQGFPSSRSSFYKASFPGDTVSIQAENVAYSSGGSSATAEDVAKMFVNMWKNSAGHRRNMLGNYQILGVGVTKSGSRYYATQIFGAE